MIFLIKVEDDFSKIWIRKTFNPQLEEPEQPPINIINKKSVIVKVPYKVKSYVLKPLPVAIEITENEAILNDCR